MNGGGILTTAGNLVIQGYATGEFKVYTTDTGKLLHTIVLEGTLAARGMASFADILTREQTDAIHAYLIGVAQRAYDNQQANNNAAAAE